MKLSRIFLERYIDLSGISDAELAEAITEKSAEVEDIIRGSCDNKHVVVGEICEISDIKNAKVRLTKTRVAPGAEPIEIVCGAPNIEVGQRVPVALVGCQLTPDFAIGVRKVCGQESHGMLCSKSELGLGADADGIWVLPEDAELGLPVGEAVPGDTIFDIDNHAITHRPDLFSVVGFARELSAMFDRDIKVPCPPALMEAPELNITKPKAEHCHRFTATQLDGVQVTSSPAWLQKLLEASGVRPINNVVDATNFVMLELGQPTHAFDAEFVAAGLAVRSAKEGEKIITLDGKECTLATTDLVIDSGGQAVALAGVMGGENSEVTSNTRSVVLEAATFDAASIRRTSFATGLAQ